MILRHVQPGDEGRLLQIFSDPTVSRWWGDPDKSVADTMNAEEGDDHYLIEVDGEVVGMIQSYQETDEMYRHAGIDISIREPWQGKGLGPEAIRLLAHHLIDDLGHHRLVIDPAGNYFWLSCETATRNKDAELAVPAQTRELVQVYSCLHR